MAVLVVASQNQHKVAEIRALLGPGLGLHSMTEMPGAPVLVEEGDTFQENAGSKALQLADWLRIGRHPAFRDWPAPVYVLADDSGLEVDALDGRPGVWSARFAVLGQGGGVNASDEANNEKLLRLLTQVPLERRTAQFRCVLAVVELGRGVRLGRPVLFEGVCRGRIGLAPAGGEGFGYDPLFIPEGMNETFGELGAEVKNRFSHRSRALRELVRHFEGRWTRI